MEVQELMLTAENGANMIKAEEEEISEQEEGSG